MREIWILGATGRIGRAVAAAMPADEVSLVLVGRDEVRLRDAAKNLKAKTRIIVAGTLEATCSEIARGAPAVVLNTVGPFTATAIPVARACPPVTHYVDASNELFSVNDVLAMNDEAASSRRTLVTGAGFGMLSTEAVVLKLCEGLPPAERVRVDAVPSVGGEGPVGDAVAASIIDNLAAGGRCYENGELVRGGFGAEAEELSIPDGRKVMTGSSPLGDLAAAQRASGAKFVIAGSSMAPTTLIARAAVRALGVLMNIRPLRELAKRRMAAIQVKAPANLPEFSWGHARVQWADGTKREGWLRTRDGMDFTCKVATEVTLRLFRGEGRPGAFTPGALFGASLAEAAGAQFIIE